MYFLDFYLFSFIQVFNYDFLIYTYFTHIEASRTVTDDLTD